MLSRSLAHGSGFWQLEARRKLTNPVLLFVHGYEHNGVWFCGPDKGPDMPVEGVARLLKKLYPGRPIVLICCNEAGLPLRVSGVWYGKGIVSSIPHGRAEWVDAISEMIEGKE